MKTISRTVLALMAGVASIATPAIAQERTQFNVAWSIYVGWMPWGYAEDHGIVDEWAEKYGLEIEVTQFNDYVESMNQFTAGDYDAVTLTNMDALSIPAAGGVDTTALIIGDFSAGNDAVILKDSDDLASIAGQDVNLVEFSVSHYLLARALDSVGLTERDLNVVNTADPDMVGAFQTDDVTAMVTWNPMVSEILSMPNANNVFDSSQIPGEIIDMMAVKTDVLEANPDFGRALTGIWYDTMQIMTADTPEGAEARAAMGAASGTDQEGYEAQLAATKLFSTPSEAVEFVTSPDLETTMDNVRSFLFDKGLLGSGAPSADVIGIELPDGTVLGDENNIKLRFTDSYMQQAADGDL
ncbi:ABC transporter substrate-binding protein [Devosia pacifica]|uniref:ABC transporter substrate-binding protein n=1 Tax=Devosia pacifica TaxID=1335967 RepID=A0A918VPK4_9HYPH|nr:putative urea ABC transporter substrate-binding protein [Devosia pacifica]GHA13708.1 ABC transporter substrate-binding protein [Devosia pacifica]